MSEMNIINADALAALIDMPPESVQCIVTSPPYWGLRDYGVEGQLGLEKTPEEFIERLVAIFREARRVLRKDGVCFVNMGDSYCGQGAQSGKHGFLDGRSNRNKRHRAATPHNLKPKDLVGMPWRLALTLQADGWWLRQDIIWHKPNPMPESCLDRCTKAHEYVFLLTRSVRYFWDADAIREKTGCETPLEDYPEKGVSWRKEGNDFLCEGATKIGPRHTHPGGSNKRSVWTIPTQAGVSDTHYATYPEKLVEPCVLAGTKNGDTVMDIFNGTGTTGLVALKLGRSYIGIELNPKDVQTTKDRLAPILAQPDFVNQVGQKKQPE